MRAFLQQNGRYWTVVPENDDVDPDMLMGWRTKRGSGVYTVENNVVNRLVLGLQREQVAVEPREHNTLLKPYQKADLDRMHTMQHFLNANPMGLGKTPETVCYLKEKGATNALIVAPKIVLYQWQYQLERWGGIQAQVYEGWEYVVPGFWIVNYEKLRQERTRTKFKGFQWQYLVLDEAHRIKNRDSQQTKAMKDLPAAHRIALTGTPITRYVDDLWSTLNFLDAEFSGVSYWTFTDYFCNIEHDEWGQRITGLTKDPRKVEILNRLMEVCSIRNNLSVTADKSYETVRLKMSSAHRKFYNSIKQLVFEELPESCTIPNGAVQTLRLMQATSWPGLYIKNEPGPKFEWILETCANNPNEKLVVFSVFEKTVEGLVQYLNRNKVGAVSITGKHTAAENELNKRFFVEGNMQVLAGTIKAMGQGYDGLQHASHIVVFIDRDWSPEIMKQAEDRLNRMGQTKPVFVYNLECIASFDQHIGRINRNRAADIREALNDEKD